MEQKTNREWLWVGAAMAAGLLLSLAYMLLNNAPTSPDSYEYMRGAQSLWSGQGFRSMTGGYQLVFPPFYPLLIGAADRLLHNPVLDGRLVSLVASIISILLVYLLARSFWPGRPAILAGWLFALLPLRITLASMVFGESTFVALILGAALLWLAANARAGWGLVAGLLLGAAYLTRPEGFFVFAMLALGLLIRLRHGECLSLVLRRVALISLGFAVVAFPYVIYLKSHTGRWQLTGKSDFNLATASLQVEGVPFERLKILARDGKSTFYTHAQDGLRGTIKRIGRNGRMELMMLAEVAGPFIFVLIGLSLSNGWWQQRRAVIWPVLAALSCQAVVAVFFFVRERTLIVAALVAILLAAPVLLSEIRSTDAQAKRAMRGLIGLLIVGTFAWMGASTLARRPEGAGPTVISEPLLAALRKPAAPAGALIGNGIESRIAAFHTGRNQNALPWGSLPRVLEYARFKGADFLLARSTDSPEVAAIANNPVTTPQLLPLAHIESRYGNKTVAMQLYRIQPATPTDR